MRMAFYFPIQGCVEFLRRDRLGDEVVHSGRAALLAALGEDAGGQGEDGDALTARLGAEAPACTPARPSPTGPSER